MSVAISSGGAMAKLAQSFLSSKHTLGVGILGRGPIIVAAPSRSVCQMSDESADRTSGVADRDQQSADGVDLAAELEASKAAAEQLRDQVLRAAAEAENVRRRAQRDVENAPKFAIEKFAAELLPV